MLCRMRGNTQRDFSCGGRLGCTAAQQLAGAGPSKRRSQKAKESSETRFNNVLESSLGHKSFGTGLIHYKPHPHPVSLWHSPVSSPVGAWAGTSTTHVAPIRNRCLPSSDFRAALFHHTLRNCQTGFDRNYHVVGNSPCRVGVTHSLPLIYRCLCA